MPLRIPQCLETSWLWPAVIACAAAGLVLVQLDPTGDHPANGSGPGMTVDESFNVAQGVQLVDRLFAGDWAGFRTIDAALLDHPPLGRLWIGVCHEVAFLVWPPIGAPQDGARVPQVAYSITCARVASALAFALTVFLVGWATGRWFGRPAGSIAALALILMPRTFGHAHLASLESCINLAYAAAVLYLADRWGASASIAPTDSSRPTISPPTISIRTAVVGGILFGLALLTKIQAVLLPIPIALWAVYVMRRRGLGFVVVWGLVGLAVLFAGWPWLRDAPWDHLKQYLGRTTDRAVIYVWYGGKVIADRDVPWHYPWLMWLATVPVGLHLVGVCGLFQTLRSPESRPRAVLILGCLTFPLIVFSIPGVAVYDGERLFSVSYPLWGVLIGRGTVWFWQTACGRLTRRGATLAVAGFLLAQSYGLFVMAPCWLSYYNLAVGGLSGADQLGLPVTYWGDGVTRDLLGQVAELAGPNGRLAVAPVLHQAQWEELRQQSPVLVQHRIEFLPLGPASAEMQYVLLFPRREYLPDEFRDIESRPGANRPSLVLAVRREGVVVAAVYRLR
ncbi:MAG: hypothetical protein EXS05_24530 [Planctomycetaceae bacterium]|nr:hypothetical protein [Planctomycetaceae bacterium]